jgi:ABC-type transport system involved in multi-copper enzyme maturation permease subunit
MQSLKIALISIACFFLFYTLVTLGIIGIAFISNGSPFPVIQHPLYFVLNSILCAILSTIVAQEFYFDQD